MNFEDDDMNTEEVDSGNETSGDDVDFPLDADPCSARDRQSDGDEYVYEVCCNLLPEVYLSFDVSST